MPPYLHCLRRAFFPNINPLGVEDEFFLNYPRLAFGVHTI